VEVEEMPLAGVVDVAFAAGAEGVAAEQGQEFGQRGVLFLQAVELGRGLVEDAPELVEAASGVLGLASGVLGAPVLGLLPQLGVAAEQVVQQPLEFGRIGRELRRVAHTMNW
jgi:hypothetical protein